MQNLKTIQVKNEYRSDVDDLVRNFYIPCLSVSQVYERAVGYFTTHGLSIAAAGLSRFVQRGGKMFLVASPFFNEEDLFAIEKGYLLREEAIQNALVRQLTSIPDEVIKSRLECIAWLVAAGRLEIRIAIRVDEFGCFRRGIYHEKVGLFTDCDGNRVAFTGSPNETAGGLIENFESIDVFFSWDDPHNRVTTKLSNFQKLWMNETKTLEVLPFPEAAKHKLLQLKPTHPPDADFELSRHISMTRSTFAPELWPHQKKAIDEWESRGRRGLVVMATGAGKTYMALVAAEKCPNLKVLIIALPRSHLVDQWVQEIQNKTRLPAPIEVRETAQKWQESLFNQWRARSLEDWKVPLVIVGTIHSLSSKAFLSILDDVHVPDESLLVVDEVHNAGALTFRGVLQNGFNWRLGLSATPQRHFDEEGTDVIEKYFDGTAYVYSLQDAIRDGYLSEYLYNIWIAQMNEDEYSEYEKLTAQIIRQREAAEHLTASSDVILSTDSEEVRRLLFQRARILKKCQQKISVFKHLLENSRISDALVYCADQEQLELAEEVVNSHGIPHLKFTFQSSKEHRRNALDALEKGHVQMLLAIDCLDEGLDIPRVSQAVILASSTNRRQFIQRRGRILRRIKGKEKAVLHDIIVVPPRFAGRKAKGMLRGELARAKEMADLAYNKEEALLALKRGTEEYGVLLTELIAG